MIFLCYTPWPSFSPFVLHLPKSYVTSLKFWYAHAWITYGHNTWSGSFTSTNSQLIHQDFFCLGRRMSQLLSQITSPYNYRAIIEVTALTHEMCILWKQHSIINNSWTTQVVNVVSFSEWFVHVLILSMMSFWQSFGQTPPSSQSTLFYQNVQLLVLVKCMAGQKTHSSFLLLHIKIRK